MSLQAFAVWCKDSQLHVFTSLLWIRNNITVVSRMTGWSFSTVVWFFFSFLRQMHMRRQVTLVTCFLCWLVYRLWVLGDWHEPSEQNLLHPGWRREKMVTTERVFPFVWHCSHSHFYAHCTNSTTNRLLACASLSYCIMVGSRFFLWLQRAWMDVSSAPTHFISIPSCTFLLHFFVPFALNL